MSHNPQRYPDDLVRIVNQHLTKHKLPVNDIPRVLEFAQMLRADGTDDEVLDATIAEYVKTIVTEINPQR